MSLTTFVFVDIVIPDTTFRVFPNDKPWVNKELKLALKRKRRAFEQGYMLKMNDIQKEIRQIIHDSKRNYKLRIETQMRGNNLRLAWQGMYTMIGKEDKKTHITQVTADEVRGIFSRIDQKKSAGPDHVRGRVLKECSEQQEVLHSHGLEVLAYSTSTKGVKNHAF